MYRQHNPELNGITTLSHLSLFDIGDLSDAALKVVSYSSKAFCLRWIESIARAVVRENREREKRKQRL